MIEPWILNTFDLIKELAFENGTDLTCIPMKFKGEDVHFSQPRGLYNSPPWNGPHCILPAV